MLCWPVQSSRSKRTSSWPTRRLVVPSLMTASRTFAVTCASFLNHSSINIRRRWLHRGCEQQKRVPPQHGLHHPQFGAPSVESCVTLLTILGLTESMGSLDYISCRFAFNRPRSDVVRQLHQLDRRTAARPKLCHRGRRGRRLHSPQLIRIGNQRRHKWRQRYHSVTLQRR